MVIPDASRFDSDRAPGLLRELRKSLLVAERVFHNLDGADYGSLLEQPQALTAHCDDGYVLGLPFGRQLLLYYEFRSLERMRGILPALLSDLGAVALERTKSETMVLDFDDHAQRHHVHPIFIGAEFKQPQAWFIMRCRDLRAMTLPDLSPGVQVRQATAADAAAITELDARVMGDQAVAPPLPSEYLESAHWTGLAEMDGKPVGYLRVLATERRGLRGEGFAVDPEGDAEPIGAALLRAAFDAGSAENRRGFSLQIGAEHITNPILAQFGFKPAGEGFRYQRRVDPAAVEAELEERIVPHIKAGKIFGMFD